MVRQKDPETAADGLALETGLIQAIPSDSFAPLSEEDELLARRVHQRSSAVSGIDSGVSLNHAHVNSRILS